MNQLSRDRQISVVSAFTEGLSVRAVERLCAVHRDTAIRLMGRVGEACGQLMDSTMRNLPCRHVQVDEQWTYVGKKQRHISETDDESKCGDFFLWSAVDGDSRAVTNFHLGKRTTADADVFMGDLASRLRNRVQISADGLTLYVDAIERAFGPDVDFAQIVKSYETEPTGPGRYSPPRVTGVEKTRVMGDPDPSLVSTSYVERLHLTNRMRVRRMTRLVDAFSRKVENLKAAIQVHYAAYNFVKQHRSLGGITPAMALGVTSRLWTVGELVDLA
jgi:IS1 family transposase